jgi:hypothetical protein
VVRIYVCQAYICHGSFSLFSGPVEVTMSLDQLLDILLLEWEARQRRLTLHWQSLAASAVDKVIGVGAPFVSWTQVSCVCVIFWIEVSSTHSTEIVVQFSACARAVRPDELLSDREVAELFRAGLTEGRGVLSDGQWPSPASRSVNVSRAAFTKVMAAFVIGRLRLAPAYICGEAPADFLLSITSPRVTCESPKL